MDTCMETRILKELGMTETEIRVYVQLLESGQSLASSISRQSKVERAVTYHILDKLIRKGLVSYVVRENRKYFCAAEPEKLMDLLQEKELPLKGLIASLSALVPSGRQSLFVEVFEGKEGFKTSMEDLLRDGSPYSIIGYTGKGPLIAPFWYKHWNERRIAAKVRRRLLVHGSDSGIEALDSPFTDCRVLPDEAIGAQKTSTIVYGRDRVLLFLPLQEFAGVRIISRETHDSYQEYFDILWKRSRRR